MDVEEKQKEKIVQKIRRKLVKRFEKEGEVAYIIARLTQNKEKIIKSIAKNEQEYAKEQYEGVLKEVKETFKKEKKLFQKADCEIREKADILNQIHQEYWEFEKQYAKMKRYQPNGEKKVQEWETDLEDIENRITNEFSKQSLEKLTKIIQEKNKKLLPRIQTYNEKQEKKEQRRHFASILFGNKKTAE